MYNINRKGKVKMLPLWGAAIALWIRLCLPHCHPGFQSQAHHLRYIINFYYCVMWKRRK